MMQTYLRSICFFMLWLTSVGYAQQKPSINKAEPREKQANYQQVVFSGRVLDQQTKGSIYGATVIVLDLDSNRHTIKTVTNRDGFYSFNAARLGSFRIEVTHTSYEKYATVNYQASTFLQKQQFQLPDILMRAINTQAPPINRKTDTMPAAKEAYLNQQLFNQNAILPTPSLYALLFDLNPGLRDMASIPPGYTLVLPQLPTYTPAVKRHLTNLFNQDSERDEGNQSALADSIFVYTSLLENTLDNINLRYIGVQPDSVRQLFGIIRTDLVSYRGRIQQVRKAKAIQLTNAVAACNELVRDAVAKNQMTRDDYQELVALGSSISAMVASKSLLDYFRQMLNNSSGRRTTPSGQPAIQFASYNQQGALANDDRMASQMFLLNDIRAFKVVVKLNNKDPNENDRFQVYFFPPGLRNKKRVYTPCDPLAAYGKVSLYEGEFDYIVYDTKKDRELEIIPNIKNSFNTRQAFTKPAKNLFGEVNFTQLIIYAKAAE